jgi:Fe-S cluster assembly ATP-binding protein
MTDGAQGATTKTMSDATLVIEDLHVSVEDKEILHGVDLVVEPGKVHALMGPNGSGKSTLAYALAGHPRYKVTGGKVTFKGEDVLELTPDERARLGMFLAMQYPVEVPGVSVTNFLRTAVNAVRGEDVPVRQFARDLRDQMKVLEMDPRFAERSLNEGFSGGEKKRHEILQMALLRPRLAILDETDSGLDIDALKVVSEGVNRLRGPELGVLLITHYTRILRYVAPDRVHVMVEGRIVASGGPELADELEERGYERWRAAPVA